MCVCIQVPDRYFFIGGGFFSYWDMAVCHVQSHSFIGFSFIGMVSHSIAILKKFNSLVNVHVFLELLQYH